MKNTLSLVRKRVAVPAQPEYRQAQWTEPVVLGNRVPKDYFITSGRGESEITVHAGSYHLALRAAGIEMCNIMTYSSILPAIAREVSKPQLLQHGSVMETIMAVSSAEHDQRATAGIIFGWLYDKRSGGRHGGLVCEYSGSYGEAEAEEQLRASLQELYENGYSDQYFLRETRLIMDSLVPAKKYGTALVSICFLNYLWPVVSGGEPTGQ